MGPPENKHSDALLSNSASFTKHSDALLSNSASFNEHSDALLSNSASFTKHNANVNNVTSVVSVPEFSFNGSKILISLELMQSGFIMQSQVIF